MLCGCLYLLMYITLVKIARAVRLAKVLSCPAPHVLFRVLGWESARGRRPCWWRRGPVGLRAPLVCCTAPPAAPGVPRLLPVSLQSSLPCLLHPTKCCGSVSSVPRFAPWPIDRPRARVVRPSRCSPARSVHTARLPRSPDGYSWPFKESRSRGGSREATASVKAARRTRGRTGAAGVIAAKASSPSRDRARLNESIN